jgi:hypothetical protein
VGETRVDLQHLLEDLRDAYTGTLEETILTEMVANALDSGAARIRLMTNAAGATLAIVDDGRGMRRRELARYHDVAASTKSRGEGIGFAGVGIKLGLLVSREVITETRRGSTHVATRWHLASRHRAPWKWIPPPGLAPERGTAVRLALTNQLSPLLDAGYLEETIRRQFEPLLDPSFDSLLRRHGGEPGPGTSGPSAPAPPPGHSAPAAGAGQPPVESAVAVGTLDKVPGRKRPARYGLLVQFESRAGDQELARLVDSTIWINEAHPAYTRSVASRATGYHTALAVALAPLAVDVRDEHAFITRFLSHWGASERAARPTRLRRRR